MVNWFYHQPITDSSQLMTSYLMTICNGPFIMNFKNLLTTQSQSYITAASSHMITFQALETWLAFTALFCYFWVENSKKCSLDMVDALNHHAVCLTAMVFHFVAILKAVIKSNLFIWYQDLWPQQFKIEIPCSIVVIS